MLKVDIQIPKHISDFWKNGILKTSNARAIAKEISQKCFAAGGIGQENYNAIQAIPNNETYKKSKQKKGGSPQVGRNMEGRILDALTNPKSKYRKIIAKNGKKHGMMIGLGFKNLPEFKPNVDLGVVFQKGRIAGFQYETGKTVKVRDLTARRKNAKTKISKTLFGQPPRPVWLAKSSDFSRISTVFSAALKKQLAKSGVSK